MALAITEVRELNDGTISDLIGWRPPLGVVSVYVDADPADRGGRWRIEVRNGLSRVVEASEHLDRETRNAVQATARRLELAIADTAEPSARGIVCYTEVAKEAGEERTFALQIPPRLTDAFHGPRPWLGPLLELAGAGAPCGIAAISSERIRLLHWGMGRIEEIHDWELELYLSDWKERKAQRPTDPGNSHAVSSSGRDQHNQRMEANRERFSRQAGDLAKATAREREWSRLVAFGDERYSKRFADGFANGCEFRFVDSSDLVSQPLGKIAARVAALATELRREDERSLLGRFDELAYDEARAAFGRDATMQALEQGRVDRLIYDARLPALEIEQMLELAVPTGAAVSPINDEAAEGLEAHGGVAALLRY